MIVVGQGLDRRLREVGESAACHDSRIRYLHLGRCGASLARNAALRVAKGDIIALTDDDCEAREDWLETLAEYFKAEPEIGVVGGALIVPKPARSGLAYCPWNSPTEAVYDPVASNYQEPEGWGWATANVALRRSVIEQVGEFDEYLGRGAVFMTAEDTDYRLRLERLGIKTRTTPRSVVYHTYGHRYGLRAIFQLKQGYAIGSGGLNAKLKLLGDPRVRPLKEKFKRTFLLNLVWQFRPNYLINFLGGVWYYSHAYHRCLREYRVDSSRGLLYPSSNRYL